MSCLYPKRVWRRTATPDKSGKWPISFKEIFNYSDGSPGIQLKIPCGQCRGCRYDKTRAWALRCMHEASLHPLNSFVTITYNRDYLPEYESLSLNDITAFLKAVRYRMGKFRYYYCGEYGSRNARPHYHILFFGLDWPDKYLWTVDKGNRIYRSDTLEKCWSKGFSTIGDVTFASAAYVARYILKKITGKGAEDHYLKVNKETGEIISDRLPEFTNMSRRPGIAREWFEKYQDDIYNEDVMVYQPGKKMRPPRYYDELFAANHSEEFALIKERRKEYAEDLAEKIDVQLKSKAVILDKKLKRLKRSLEGDL
jgi:hypothetical protein